MPAATRTVVAVRMNHCFAAARQDMCHCARLDRYHYVLAATVAALAMRQYIHFAAAARKIQFAVSTAASVVGRAAHMVQPGMA